MIWTQHNLENEYGARKTFLKLFETRIRGCLWTHLASAKRPHLGMTACRAGFAGYPSGKASECVSGCATGCGAGRGAGCPSGSLSNFFDNCGPNKENASSSIACIRRRVSFMSISDSSLEELETDSDLSRFLSRSWNVTQHLSGKIDSKCCLVIIFHPLVTKAVRTDHTDLHIIEISQSLVSDLDPKLRLKLSKKKCTFSALRLKFDDNTWKKKKIHLL